MAGSVTLLKPVLLEKGTRIPHGEQLLRGTITLHEHQTARATAWRDLELIILAIYPGSCVTAIYYYSFKFLQAVTDRLRQINDKVAHCESLLCLYYNASTASPSLFSGLYLIWSPTFFRVSRWTWMATSVLRRLGSSCSMLCSLIAFVLFQHGSTWG